MNNNMTTYYLHNEGNIFAKGSVLVQFRKIVGEEKGILSTCVSDSYLIIYIYIGIIKTSHSESGSPIF